MNLKEKLNLIQVAIKCNKGQFNSFGKYNYRSCEDIFEAVKPYLKETKTVLTLQDEIWVIEGRFYVKATATLSDCESNEVISNIAFARESEKKTGMDDSQVTGATSSYARKYALNGLFLLDDVKDADTNEFTQQTKVETKPIQKPVQPQPKPKKPAPIFDTATPMSDATRDNIFNIQPNYKKRAIELFELNNLNELTEEQARYIISCINGATGGKQ